MSKLTCLVGVIGGGKTCRGEKVVKKEGFIHINFADELREVAWDILEWRPQNEQEYEDFKLGKINILGFGYINGRKFLQNLGTAIKKRDPHFWVRCWEIKLKWLLIEGKDIVCSDLRFKNELIFALNLDISRISCYNLNKDFIFCNYKSKRYDSINEHESEKLAQIILKDGYKDGDILNICYLRNLCMYRKGELK